MNNITRSKLVVYLTALFVAGAAAGAFAARPHTPKPKQQDATESIRRRLRHKLNLTPEQEQKLEPYIISAGAKMKAIHDRDLKDVNQASDELDAQVVTVLTPDQAEKLAKMQKDRHDSMNRCLNAHSAEAKPKPQ